MWTQAYIHHDGSVKTCCGGPILGNINGNNSLDEIFNSEIAISLRQDFASSDMPECFNNCPNLVRLGKISNIEDLYLSPSKNPCYNPQRDYNIMMNYEIICEAFRQGSYQKKIKPLAINVSLGEACNLRCRMCPQNHDNKVHLHKKSLDNLDASLECCLYLTITGGEPLVYSSCLDLIEKHHLFSTPISHLALLTNAQLLNPELICQKFNKINNLGFGISIDSCKKETYEYIRANGNWDTLIENLTFLLDYIRKNNKNWTINLGFTIMKSNLNEIIGAMKLAKSLDVGLGFGPITGKYYPIDKMRFYLNENIFEFQQKGYEKHKIEKILQEAVNVAEKLWGNESIGTKNNLNGIIDYLGATPRLNITSHQLNRILNLNDEQLRFVLRTTNLIGKYSIISEFAALIMWRLRLLDKFNYLAMKMLHK